MTDVKTVRLTLPLPVWGRLASAADTEQSTVEQIIADAIKVRLGRDSVPPRVLSAPVVVPVKPVPVSKSLRVLDDAAVVSLHAEGFNDSEIARRLGFHNTTIRERRQQLGLPSNHANRAYDDDILRLHGEGLNDREIGDKVGLQSARIFKIRQRLGLIRNDSRGGIRKSQPTKGNENAN